MSSALRLSRVVPMDLSSLFSGKVSRIESRITHMRESRESSVPLGFYCFAGRARLLAAAWPVGSCQEAFTMDERVRTTFSTLL